MADHRWRVTYVVMYLDGETDTAWRDVHAPSQDAAMHDVRDWAYGDDEVVECSIVGVKQLADEK